MTDTIDRLVRMLDEEREGRAAERERHVIANTALFEEQRQKARVAKDLKAAEDKIEEWIAYSGKLINMLRTRKVLEEKFPPAPEPLRDYPF